ncbi:hypothetical protein V8E51_011033 [Hyaloscypha variabilis]
MSSNTGSYVLSPQESSMTSQPPYVQQPQRNPAQPTHHLPYNQQTNSMSQFSPSAAQSQDYPPSYAQSHTPYPNIQGGGPPVSQQPTSEPSPVAQEDKKPLFTPETKEKTKALCAECGSGAKWACGASLLIFGCMCSFCGLIFS